MIKLINAPTLIQAAGNKPKRIEEFIGLASSHHKQLSIARMESPQGWEEPGQRPEFTEFTIVLRGSLTVETDNDTLVVAAGQAVIAEAGDWVRYSTPREGGAEYVAICLPAFSPNTVHRDE